MVGGFLELRNTKYPVSVLMIFIEAQFLGDETANH
jgi:hypothetical protein